MEKDKRPQVFLSYAHNDLKIVRTLYTDLKGRGVNVWFDKENLSPGKWKSQIQKAIPKSRYFLFCVSKSALEKAESSSGFVDDELQQAYEIAMAQDERHFTIIPVRLEKDIGYGDHRLSIFQQYDLSADWESEIDRLAVLLGGRAKKLKTRIDIEFSEDKRLVVGLMSKAEIAYYANQYEIALQLWESVITINPEIDSAWSNKGAALAALGNYERALEAINKAIGLNKNSATSWFNKAVLMRKLGRIQEAVTYTALASELGYKFKPIPNEGSD